jgi:hypothetical protein
LPLSLSFLILQMLFNALEDDHARWGYGYDFCALDDFGNRRTRPQPRCLSRIQDPVPSCPRGIELQLLLLLSKVHHALHLAFFELAMLRVLPGINEVLSENLGEVPDTAEVLVITLLFAGKQRMKTVMKIVGPLSIEPVTAAR